MKRKLVILTGPTAAGKTKLSIALAKKINGEIIGVAPHFMHEFEDIYKDCTKTIYTESMAERKSIMEFSANAFTHFLSVTAA